MDDLPSNAGEKMEPVAVSREAVAASVSGDKKCTHSSSAESAKRSLPFSP